MLEKFIYEKSREYVHKVRTACRVRGVDDDKFKPIVSSVPSLKTDFMYFSKKKKKN